MANNDTRLTELERDAALSVAVDEASRRESAERVAVGQQIRAEDAERVARTMSASAVNAAEDADNVRSSAWTGGLIAVVVLIGLIIGGAWLYNGYQTKNDQLYSATVKNVQTETEKRMMAQENARNASRPNNVTVTVQTPESTPIPAPTATPASEPQVIVVPTEATPVPEITATPLPAVDNSATAPSTTTTTTGSNGTAVENATSGNLPVNGSESTNSGASNRNP